MPDKLTDNEIVKALEICSKYTDVRNCENCPLKPNCDVNVLETLSLDLINHLQAENSNLTSDLTSLQNDLTSLQAENERLKGAIKSSKETKQRLRAEICVKKKLLDIAEERFKNIKAEAYKEFAERLKQVFWSKAECDFLIRNIVDNLLKEMVGEDK